MCQLLLVEHAQHIRLILGCIRSAQQLPARGLPLHAGKVAGSHVLRTKAQRFVEQKCPANVAIAFQAGVGSGACAVAIQKKLHHLLAKNLLGINHMKWNCKLAGNCARLEDCLWRAALIVAVA